MIITGVLQGGPAARAGIRPGDVILQVDGKPVSHVPELLNMVAALKPGAPSTFAVQRGDETLELKVVPDLRPRMPRPALR